MTECIICLEKSDKIINTKCCLQNVHKACLTSWLSNNISRGRCPYCRKRIRGPRNIPSSLMGDDGDFEVETSLWNNPGGYIKITTSYNNCDVSIVNNTDINVPKYHKCCITHMENLPNEYISNGDIIVLTDENNNYFDILNVPVGWIIAINNHNHSLQISYSLRIQ